MADNIKQLIDLLGDKLAEAYSETSNENYLNAARALGRVEALVIIAGIELTINN